MIALLKYNPAIKKHVLFAVLVLALLCFGVYALPGYMPWRSVNFMIAVAGLPVIIYDSIRPERSLRFVYVALGAALLSLLMPVRSLVFISMLATVLALIENTYGRISVIPLLVILIISPVFYVVNIFSFSIRLELTNIAGMILNQMGADAFVTGNMITCKGNEYTVDPACMGLKMLMTSLWFGLYLVHFIQKRYNKRLSVLALLATLVATFLLNIITNLVRIVLLVYFDIPAESVMHDIAGLCCFVLYTIVPSIFIFSWFVKRFGKEVTKNDKVASAPRYSLQILFTGVVIIILFFSGRNITETEAKASIVLPRAEGYEATMFSADVVKLKSDKALIYVKTIEGFYASEHNPLMCWIGSGYEFEELQKKVYGSNVFYTGTLRNGADVLYTAWWYDNGTNRTIEQLEWRWDMLKGSNAYAVVNVTCNTEEELEREINKIIDKNVLKIHVKQYIPF